MIPEEPLSWSRNLRTQSGLASRSVFRASVVSHAHPNHRHLRFCRQHPGPRPAGRLAGLGDRGPGQPRPGRQRNQSPRLARTRHQALPRRRSQPQRPRNPAPLRLDYRGRRQPQRPGRRGRQDQQPPVDRAQSRRHDQHAGVAEAVALRLHHAQHQPRLFDSRARRPFPWRPRATGSSPRADAQHPGLQRRRAWRRTSRPSPPCRFTAVPNAPRNSWRASMPRASICPCPSSAAACWPARASLARLTRASSPIGFTPGCRKRPLKYIGFNGTGCQVRDCLHARDLLPLVAQQIRSPARMRRACSTSAAASARAPRCGN